MLRALLCDWDGTLIDGFAAIERGWKAACERFGVPYPSSEEIRRMTGKGAGAFRRLFGPAAEEALAVYHAAHDEALFAIEPLAGAEALLQTARRLGLRVAVVTSKTQSRVEAQLRHLGWQAYFDAIIGLAPGRRQKPDAHTLELALAQLGVDATDAAMLGDGIADMQAARFAGCRWAVGLLGSYREEELLQAGADWCAPSLGDVAAWLEQTIAAMRRSA